MGNCVESFGEVEKENVGLFVIVYGGSPIMNCLHELSLTGVLFGIHAGDGG